MPTSSRSYAIAIEVSRPPHHVFECLRDVSKWWGGKDLQGSTRLLHDEFTIRHGEVHYSRQRMVELVPERRIVWLVTESRLAWLENKDEWTGTRLIFDVTAKDRGTELHFVHEGLVPERECYPSCSGGWSLVIEDYLFNFIEEGRIAARLFA